MLLELNELSIDVQGGLLITADGFLQVSGLEMDANFQSANLHLDNLLGGEDFGENINNLLTAFAPAIWNEVLEIQIFRKNDFHILKDNFLIFFSSRMRCLKKSMMHWPRSSMLNWASVQLPRLLVEIVDWCMFENPKKPLHFDVIMIW